MPGYQEIGRPTNYSPDHRLLLDALKQPTPTDIMGSVLKQNVELIILEIFHRDGPVFRILEPQDVESLYVDPMRKRLTVNYLGTSRRPVYYNTDFIDDFSFVRGEDMENARPNMPIDNPGIKRLV